MNQRISHIKFEKIHFMKNHDSDLRQRLIESSQISNLVENNQPGELIKLLEQSFSFKETFNPNDLTDFFDICFAPMLQNAVNKQDIDLYSFIDHQLFSKYINKIEDIEWFKKSFNDVARYGIVLGHRIKSSFKPPKSSFYPNGINGIYKKILFVIKGPFKLAHADVFSTFLNGLNKNNTKNIIVTVLFLDDAAKNFERVRVISFQSIKTTKEKIRAYEELTHTQTFYNIIWIACIQNLPLYLSLKRSHLTSYWTMKRHSIAFRDIDKYATLFSTYKNKFNEGVFWYGGRCSIDLKEPTLLRKDLANKYPTLKKVLQNKGSVVFGSLARSQKYHEISYWEGVLKLLEIHTNAYFVYGHSGNTWSEEINKIINNNPQKSRVVDVGWLNGDTRNIAQIFDIYLDTIPFGTGVPAAEAIMSGAAFVGTLSKINEEASLVTLMSQAKGLDPTTECEQIGILAKFEKSIRLTNHLILNTNDRKTINSNQKQILQESITNKEDFTSDYMEYFCS